MNKIIKINNLEFCYENGAKNILNIKEFHLNEGEQIFISGSSGSGKTTFLKLISGILQPKSGKIDVIDRDISLLSSNQRDIFRGDYIGFIFQQFNLLPYLSVIENVILPCRFSKIKMKNTGNVLKTALELLKKLDLKKELWDKKAKNLSVGQQQRVACARALIGRPPLIIADEPTSALDAERQQAFLDLLQQECKENGSSLLFVSHDKRLSEKFDRIIDLEQLNSKE